MSAGGLFVYIFMLKKQFKNGWTQVPNAIINHAELSFKAKGLWMYINSKPENWDFAMWRIANETKEGEKSIRTGLQELVKFGYLEYKTKTKDGKLAGQEYILKDEPDALQELPKQEPLKRVVPKTCGAQNGGGISNTISSNTISSKKELENPTKIQNNLEIKSNPLYEQQKHLFFPDLTDEEIDVLVSTYIIDYPKSKPSSIFNFLKEKNQNKKKDKQITEKIEGKKETTAYSGQAIKIYQTKDESREEFDLRIDEREELTGSRYERNYFVQPNNEVQKMMQNFKMNIKKM